MSILFEFDFIFFFSRNIKLMCECQINSSLFDLWSTFFLLESDKYIWMSLDMPLQT